MIVSGVRTKSKTSQAETRQMLLDAAGAVFAEHGYRSTTVRQICRRAGANVAAVNYHFGDKERLYLEVIRQAHGRALAKYPLDLGVAPDAPPEARLRAFVRSFLLRVFDKGPTSWMGKLIAMEMINPSVALDSLVRERIRPMADLLGRIVAQLLGARVDARQVRLCGFSIVGQCLFYAHCRSMLAKLYPEQHLDLEEAERLAGHITAFSLAALKSQADGVATRPSKLLARGYPRSEAPRAAAKKSVAPTQRTSTPSNHQVN